MGIRVAIHHHVVDALPHGQAVAVVQECGEVHYYLSRQHSLDRIAADLTVVASELVLDAYRIDERPQALAV